MDPSLQGLVAQQLPIVKRADLILLDPPRTGAGEVVVKQMAKFGPRKILYVARSTMHGTPVKSCIITRAGVN